MARTGSAAGALRRADVETVDPFNCFPQNKETSALADLYEIWMADTRANANKALDRFLATYQAKYPKATHCFEKDRDEMLALAVADAHGREVA